MKPLLIEFCLRLIEIGLELLPKIRGNVITYTSNLSSTSTGGSWQQALQLLQQMERAGPQPNVPTCSAAINACKDPAA